MRHKSLLPWLCLAYMGLSWGLSFSMAKLAADTGAHPFVIAFWQTSLSSLILFGICHIRGRKFSITRHSIPTYLALALLGSAIPGVAFYYSAAKVPAGVLSLTVSLIPALTYAIALAIKSETLEARRLLGLMLGFSAICLVILPDTSLPTKGMTFWVLLACFSSLSYASENIFLAERPLDDIGPLRLSCGMNLFAALLLLPLAGSIGEINAPFEGTAVLPLSILGLSLISVTAYTLFIFSVRQFGAIFASQVGYVVTLCGLLWGIVLFNEVHSPWIWSAFVVMMIGLFFVKPRSDRIEDQKS